MTQKFFDDLSLLEDILLRTCKAGANDAEIRTETGISVRAEMRNRIPSGAVAAERNIFHLTAYVGTQVATVSANRIDDSVAAALIERAVAMARAAPASPFAGLPDPRSTASGDDRHLALLDPATPATPTLEALAAKAEAAALSDPRVRISDGFAASWSISTGRHLTSRGLHRERRGSRYGLSGGVIATDGAENQASFAAHSARWLADLVDPQAMGDELAAAATRKLGARKIASCTAPVIIDEAIASHFIAPLLAAMDGHAVAQKRSFLTGRIGERIFGKGITLVDDPFLIRGTGSAAADAEGVLPQRRNLVDDGILSTWLLDSAAARQLGLVSTGHAGGPYNMALTPGRLSRAEMLNEARSGLLVTEMFSPSLNANSGEWAVGVAGQWFDHGEIVHAVEEVTIGGSLLELYAEMVSGADLRCRGNWMLPSLLLPRARIGGR